MRTLEQENRLRLAKDLRSRGKTWDEIGDRLGISRQAASQLVKRAERGRKRSPRGAVAA